MVAFGWRLHSSRNPGWEDHYVDYAALKTQIKTIQRQEREGLRDVAVDENAVLLDKLTHDLRQVSAFWDERCERYEHEFEDLRQRVAEMRAASDRGSPPPPGEKKGNDSPKGDAVASTWTAVASTSPFRSVSTRAISSAVCLWLSGSMLTDCLWLQVFEEEQRETALLKEFTLLRAQLERLDAFQKLNEEAVRKIIKKHNKQNPFFAGTIDTAALLDQQSFLRPAQTNHPLSLLKRGVAVEQSLMDQFGRAKIVEMWMWLRQNDAERRVQSLNSLQLSDRKKMSELGEMQDQGLLGSSLVDSSGNLKPSSASSACLTVFNTVGSTLGCTQHKQSIP